MKWLRILPLFLLCSFTAAYAQEQWIQASSPHFQVLTNTGEQRGREAALQFEQLRFVFSQLFFKDGVDPATALQVIAFKSESQLSDFAPLYQGKPVRIVGFYLRSQDKDYVVLDLGAPGHSEALFHEYSHLLLDNNLPDAPAWFSEGFAQFCSSIRISSKQVVIGMAPQQARTTVRNEKLLPAAMLLNVDHASPMYNDDRSPRSLFYAQSWLAVHYLWSNHKLDAARDYLRMVQQRMPQAEAFKRAFGMDASEFEAALERYSRTDFQSLRVNLPEHLTHVSVNVGVISSADAAATLADLHAHQQDYRQQSLQEFQSVLQQEPDNAIAQRGLGYALFNEHHPDDSLPHLRKAAQQHPEDWLVHYYVAEVLAQRNNESDAAEIERQARVVTRLNPALADGYGLLGFGLMLQHRTGEAAAAYETAFRLKPQSEPYALNLAELFTRQGKFEQAKKLFAFLQNSHNTYIATAARSHLELMAAPR